MKSNQLKQWNEKVTFLCGHRKSGTTLILSLFDNHPDLAVFPPDSGFFYGYHPLYDSKDYTDSEKIDRVIKVLYETNFKNDLEKLEAWSGEFPYQELEDTFRKCIGETTCSTNNMISMAVYAYQQVASRLNNNLRPPTQVDRWIEKTTSTEIYAGDIFKWFPKAKIVHLIRDPRDNYASLKSGWETRYEGQNDEVNRLLQSMMDRGLLGLKQADINISLYGPDRYKVVKFEDLVANPESVMRETCAFLDIAFHKNLLVPSYYGLPWKGNNFEGLKFSKPSSKNVNRWKERITEHEARVIEFYFGVEMSKWGYTPVYSMKEQVNAAMEHYKWHNFSHAYSAKGKANTYK